MSDLLGGVLAASGLLTIGDHVLVAVSGGPDSLALLHALHASQTQIGLTSLSVAHLDHGLRADESAADAKFVAAFCAALDIPCHIGFVDAAALANARKISIQQAARDARYGFLEQTAQTIGADKIATAHTQDDQVETVLMSILRGTGLDGLRGIPERRGLYVRPLLHTTRIQIIEYCIKNGLEPRQDASNLEADHYTRNRVRLELLPNLERDYNPAVRQALLRLSQIADRDADYLQQQALAAMQDAILSHCDERFVLDRHKLAMLHPSLLRYVLRAALLRTRGHLVGVSHVHVEQVYDAVTGRHRLPFGLTTPAPHCAVRVTPRRVTFS